MTTSHSDVILKYLRTYHEIRECHGDRVGYYYSRLSLTVWLTVGKTMFYRQYAEIALFSNKQATGKYNNTSDNMKCHNSNENIYISTFIFEKHSEIKLALISLRSMFTFNEHFDKVYIATAVFFHSQFAISLT